MYFNDMLAMHTDIAFHNHVASVAGPAVLGLGTNHFMAATRPFILFIDIQIQNNQVGAETRSRLIPSQSH